MRKLPRRFSITMEAQVAIDQATSKYLVYLIHFHFPLFQTDGRVCSHYIGLTSRIVDRMYEHCYGMGWQPIRDLWIQGGEFTIMKVWEQDGHFERAIKQRKEAWKYCTECRVNRGIRPVMIERRKRNETKSLSNRYV